MLEYFILMSFKSYFGSEVAPHFLNHFKDLPRLGQRRWVRYYPSSKIDYISYYRPYDLFPWCSIWMYVFIFSYLIAVIGALQIAFSTPIFLELGVPKTFSAYAWLAGPISGK